jgi:hypothetical protein
VGVGSWELEGTGGFLIYFPWFRLGLLIAVFPVSVKLDIGHHHSFLQSGLSKMVDHSTEKPGHEHKNGNIVARIFMFSHRYHNMYLQMARAFI